MLCATLFPGSTRAERFHMRPMSLVLVGVVTAVACGGESSGSRAPTSPSAPPAPTEVTLSGQIVAFNGGQPIPGVAIDAGGVTTTSDGNGGFTVTLPSGSLAQRVVLT